MKKNNFTGLIPALFICILSVTGISCSKKEQAHPTGPGVVEDDLSLIKPGIVNRKIIMDKPAERVIVGEMGCAIALAKMGLIDRVVGTTIYIKEEIPGYQDVPSIGSRTGIDMELVVSLKPDLFIEFKSHSDPVSDELEKAGIKVYSIGTITNLEHIKKHIKNYGILLGAQKQAQSILDEMNTIETKVSNALAKLNLKEEEKPRVFVFGMMGEKDALQTWAPGKNTIVEDLVKKAGGRLITVEQGLTGWPQYNIESLLVADPDIIILGLGAPYWDSVEEFEGKAIARNLKAVKSGDIYAIDKTFIFELSYRNAYALEELLWFLHKVRV